MTFTLEAINDATSGLPVDHLWSVVDFPTGANANINSPTSFITNVTVSDPGTYIFDYFGNDGVCDFENQITIEIPEPLVVSGPIFTCAPDGSTYTVTYDLSGGTEPFFVNGIEVTGSTFVSEDIINGDSYSFTFTDANGCGQINETGNHLCDCTSDAGSMSLDTISICGTGQAVATFNNDATLDLNDGLVYILHTSPTSELGGILSIQNTNSFNFQPGYALGVVYYISAVVGTLSGGTVNLDDPCLSISPGQPVVWYPVPDVDAIDDFSVCGFEANLSGTSNINVNFFWEQIAGPNGMPPEIIDPSSSATDVNFFESGNYLFSLIGEANGCTDTEEVLIEIQAPVSIENITEACNGENYTVSFDIVTGTAPFLINGNPSTASFESEPIPSNGAYNFFVSDANGCSFEISGSKNCDCESEAAPMPSDLIQVCGDEAVIIAASNENSVLDTNDRQLYYLHTNSGPNLGTIIGFSVDGTFNFSDQMVFDSIYYVSTVVGNALGDSLDLADPCLDVSSGQPVLWNKVPDIQVDDMYILCGRQLILEKDSISDYPMVNFSPLPPLSPSNLTISETQSSWILNFSIGGTFQLAITSENNGCLAIDTLMVAVDDLSFISIENNCLPNGAFTYTLELNSEFSPIIIENDTLTGGTYETDIISAGDTLSLLFTNSLGCTIDTMLTAICPCSPPQHIMDSDTIITCDLDSIIQVTPLAVDTIYPEDQITYILHTSDADTLGDVLDINQDGIFTYDMSIDLGAVYFISFVSGDSTVQGQVNLTDSCLSVSLGQPISWINPPEINAGVSDTICGLTYLLQGSIELGTAQWTSLTGNPGSTNFNGDDPMTIIEVSQPGLYRYVLSSTSFGCLVSDTVSILFTDPLTFNIQSFDCDEDNLFYDLNIAIQGGLPPYIINGMEAQGNLITVSDIPSNDPFTLLLSDLGPCNDTSFVVNFDCSCPATPGQLDETPIELCAGESIQLQWLADPDVSDPNFASQIYLHDGTPNNIGNILAVFDDPLITYQNDFPLNEVLFITSLVGPVSNGIIDLEDPCTIIGSSIPIEWKSLIEYEINTEEQWCIGDTAILNIQLNSPSYPIEMALTGIQLDTTLLIESSNEVILTFLVSTNDLIDIQINNESCIAQDSEAQIALNVIDCSCTTYSFSPLDSICGDEEILNLDDWSTDDLNGMWDIINSTSLPSPQIDESFITLEGAGTGLTIIQFTPIDSNHCDTLYTFNLFVENYTSPVSSVNGLSYCESTDTVLNLNQLLISPLNGEWLLESENETTVIEQSALSINSLGSGNYQLVFIPETVPLICEQTALMIPLSIVNEPEYLITSIDPDCFDENGMILIESADSLTVVLNGQQQNNPSIMNLSSGFYEVALQSDLCEIIESITLTAPIQPQVTLESTIEDTPDGSIATIVADASVPFDDVNTTWFVNGNVFQTGIDSLINISLIENTEVLIQIIDEFGCSAEDLIIISIGDQEIVFPNVFNPNGNGVNTRFNPQLPNGYDWLTLRIYDRWGNLMYDQNPSATNGWDGNFNNQICQPGVYPFFIQITNRTGDIENYWGELTLIR